MEECQHDDETILNLPFSVPGGLTHDRGAQICQNSPLPHESTWVCLARPVTALTDPLGDLRHVRREEPPRPLLRHLGPGGDAVHRQHHQAGGSEAGR